MTAILIKRDTEADMQREECPVMTEVEMGVTYEPRCTGCQQPWKLEKGTK